VAWHVAWGQVSGQVFADEAAARARFAELDGGSLATVLLGPGGEELQYYGGRGGRESEMREWWVSQHRAGTTASSGEVEVFLASKVYPEDGPPPLDCLVIGAGARGCVYSSYPGLRPVAVAEPNAPRRARFAARHGIPPDCLFECWEDALAASGSRFRAEVCIVTTPDQKHAGPAVAACAHFRGLLLEKPMAVSEEDCERIARACEAHGTICAVCHVLRYNFANAKVRELIQSGAIGEVLTINHTEPVGYYHFAHSFVRGNWRSEAESTNSLLAKCCHDVDLIALWMGQDRCVRVSSFGSLQHFRREKKPPEALDAKRCLDCALRETCAYSAPRLYLRSEHSSWAQHLVTEVPDVENVSEALRTGPYGRCVYECDNDVCDHQVVTFEFASGATASLTMIATSERLCERETKVYGSAGELSTSDPCLVRHVDFATGGVREYRPDAAALAASQVLGGHGGADGLLCDAFVRAMRAGDKGLVLTGPWESLASHRLAFAADGSRKMQRVRTCCDAAA